MTKPRPLSDKVWLLFPNADKLVDNKGILTRERHDLRLDATVVAVGPEVPDHMLGVGDKVIAKVFDGMPVEFEGIIYRCVSYTDILAILE